ncbi:MAG: hypothetical protein U1F30_07575 [Steroidobacteraceae bacterium]
MHTAKDYARDAGGRDLLARQPPVDGAKQRIGWTIIGQSQFDQGVYDEAEGLRERLAQAAPTAAEYSDITERLAASVYRQGEAKRKAGDDAGAADDFPARGACRGLEDRRDVAVRRRGGLDQHEAVGPRHPGARGLPARLPEGVNLPPT